MIDAEEDANDSHKAKKFSKAETQLIMKVIDEYLVSNNLAVEDLIAGLQESKTDRKKHSIWNELSLLMPHRKQAAIRQHAERKLIRQNVNLVWSEEDKNKLINLVKLKGNLWVEIGRLLGKPAEDCKHLHKRLTKERQKTGRFSNEEDAELLNTVREVLGYDKSVSINDFKDQGLPWTTIAEKLKNIRQSLDYVRHWPVLKNKTAKQLILLNTNNNNNFLINQNSSCSSSNSVKHNINHNPMHMVAAKSDSLEGNMFTDQKAFDVKWLEYVDKFEAEDESEVIWAEIDRKMKLKYSFSAKKWRTMTKGFDIDNNFQQNLQELKRVYPGSFCSDNNHTSNDNDNNNFVNNNNDNNNGDNSGNEHIEFVFENYNLNNSIFDMNEIEMNNNNNDDNNNNMNSDLNNSLCNNENDANSLTVKKKRKKGKKEIAEEVEQEENEQVKEIEALEIKKIRKKNKKEVNIENETEGNQDKNDEEENEKIAKKEKKANKKSKRNEDNALM